MAELSYKLVRFDYFCFPSQHAGVHLGQQFEVNGEEYICFSSLHQVRIEINLLLALKSFARDNRRVDPCNRSH